MFPSKSNLLLIPCLLASSIAWAQPPIHEKPATLRRIEHFDSDSIKYPGEGSWRWLSIPDSRLVLNPYTVAGNGEPPTKENLALHAGFFIGKSIRGDMQKNLVAVDLKPGEAISQTWWPYKLELSGVDRDTGMAVKATDFLADALTIVRVIEVTPANRKADRSALTIRGSIKGKLLSKEQNFLVSDNGEYFTATCLSNPKTKSAKSANLLGGLEVTGSTWKIVSPGIDPGGGTITAAIGFSLKAEGPEQAIQRARKALMEKPAAELLTDRKEAWDRLLSQVPHPVSFGVEGHGQVPADTHRLWYYGAWTFLLGQLMPPLPENNYPHYSIAEGKPSLWAEGDPNAPAQCSWTCFMAVGLLAPMMPDRAWDIYEGIMSGVDDAGVLRGECLPSRKAHGAWMLVNATGDQERLRRVYPAIKRYLIWREKNPRWIWGSGPGAHDIPDEKDSDFVASHLIDVDYAVRIASMLGLKDDVAFWREMTAREIANYRQWFFADGNNPKNFYFTEHRTHTFKDRTEQNASYILNGLAFRGLPDDIANSLRGFYLQLRTPGKPMLGIDFVKYGETSFIAYGLQDQGMRQEADEFVAQMLVDTMRPQADFAEELRLANGKPVSTGVRPSMFLALQMIDFTLIRNGVRIDQDSYSARIKKAN